MYVGDQINNLSSMHVITERQVPEFEDYEDRYLVMISEKLVANNHI